jgi:hypothetical protein
MITADPKDFTVDLVTREVRHKSGAAVCFREYQTEAEWRLSRVGSLICPDLFQGLHKDLLAAAKHAAIAAGMKHRKP